MENAIAKINAEMQKDPDNTYLEIVGHYIIDRCAEPAVTAAVNGGKTLAGAMEAITSVARKKVSSKCAVMRDAEIFDAIDKYLGVGKNHEARAKSKREVDGGEAYEANPPKLLDLSFEDLL